MVTTNYRSRYGEIDIIALDGDTLVFVEVRFRSRQHFGGGAASVDARKQAKISKTAACYLQRTKRMQGLNCRFDVLDAHPADKSGQFRFNWYKNAFYSPA